MNRQNENCTYKCYRFSRGAAIAAFRHCEAMREAGLDAEMLVLVHEKKSVPYVHSIIANGKWAKIKSVLINQIMRFLLMPFHPWAVFSFPFYLCQ